MNEVKRPQPPPEERLGEAVQDWLMATDTAGSEYGSAHDDDLDLLFGGSGNDRD